MSNSKTFDLKRFQKETDAALENPKANRAAAQKLMEMLIQQIEHLNYQYYVLDRPEVSDYDYDIMLKLLEALEKVFPEHKKTESPTHRVGGQVLAQFRKVAHRLPMISLSNTYSIEEILAFDQRVKKVMDLSLDKAIHYLAEPKFDGLAIELIYVKGLLTQALTRGDGVTGEDVTANVRTIRGVPLKLRTSAPPNIFEVRGEILLFKKDFATLNKQQEEDGEEPFANPRNAAAGSIRQLDPKIAASRPLRAFFYGPGFTDWGKVDKKLIPQTQGEFEKLIKEWGLPVNNLFKVCQGIDEVTHYYASLEKKRHSLEYEIDGIVAKVDDLNLQKDLGTIARSPRWAIAAKYQPEQVETVIEKIEVQVGRTGALTPVAIMKPAKVGGVTVMHATLHNQDEIDRKDIREGDHVILQRAGDVIPEIVSVILAKRPKNSKPFKLPTRCPTCDAPVKKEEGEAVTRCENPLCMARLKESLKHFVSRRAMNVEKLGDRLIDQLVDLGLVKSFSDIYRLNAEKLEQLPRQGEKSVQNLTESIERSRKSTLARLIFAMGIRFVGEQTAKLLAKHFRTLDRFLETSEDELLQVDEVGEKVGKSISTSLSSRTFVKEMRDIVKLGVMLEKITAPKESSGGSLVLDGKTFVITGTLDGMSRDEARDFIESNGGAVSSAVSKKTSYLLCGSDAGSKLTKAEGLGVTVISLSELIALVGKK